MSLEKELVKIYKRIEDEKRLGDKRAEQFYNLMFSGNATPIFARVGIGTAAPAALLHSSVVGGAGTPDTALMLTDRGGSVGDGAKLDFAYWTTNILNASIYAQSATDGGGALILATAPADGNAPVMGFRLGKDLHIDIYDWDDSVLREVSFGADDSGGTGFKVLKVPN